jgi:hypothetical protein
LGFWNSYFESQWEKEELPNKEILLSNRPTPLEKNIWNIISPLVELFSASKGALTPRHANIFLRHLKVAINTQSENPYKLFSFNAPSPELKTAVGFALLGIASPKHFNILKVVDIKGANQISSFLSGTSNLTARNKKVDEVYAIQLNRNWKEDWDDFKYTPLVEKISKENVNPIDAAAELIWL